MPRAGMAADATDLSAPLWIMFALAIASGLIATFLYETAPSQLARRQSRP